MTEKVKKINITNQKNLKICALIDNLERLGHLSHSLNQEYSEKLQNYDYITDIIPCGRYIRWIYKKTMSLNSGGFVTSDNGYSVTVICNDKKCITINKKKGLFFLKLNNSDYIKQALFKSSFL